MMAISVGIAGAASVENDRLLFAFDDRGNLNRIYNKATSQEYYHGDGKRVVRVLRLADKALADVQLQFAGSESSAITDGKRLTLKYTGEGITATVRIDALDGDPKSHWTLTVENNGDAEVMEVVFPDLDRIRIGSDPKDDTLMRANRDGQKIPNPVENLFKKDGDIADGVKYGSYMNNETLPYSGMAGMFWMDLYDKTGGLYVASEDKELIGGYLQNAVGGNVGMALGKYLRVKRGQSFTLPYAVGVHTGDWHWGADRYREWAMSFFHKAHIARWVREMPNWYWRAMLWTMGEQKPKFKSDFTWNDLNGKLMDGALKLHSYNIGIAGNEFLGHDYPFWFPDPMLGSEDTIRTEMKKVKRRGGHVVPYLNPIYSWENYPNVPHADEPEFQDRLKQVPSDIKQPLWSIYKNDVAREYDGSCNYVEWHYYAKYPQMCMASKEWQDFMLWWTHKYATDYGFSGVQWDQLGAYPMQYCTDWSHGHQHGGTGPSGTVELSRRIYEDPDYKVDPDFYIWYEGGGDCTSQYMQNAVSGWDCWHPYTFPNMIQYTFEDNFYSGDYTPPDGSTGNALVRQKRSTEFAWLGRYKLGVGAGDYAEKVGQTALLMNAIKGVYWYTKFKDNLGCVAPEGMWTNVLQIDPTVCPYVAKDGFVIPYADMRKDRKACEVKLSKKLYDLAGVKQVYWYPNDLQGMRREIRFDNSKPDYLIVRLPDLGNVNIYSYANAYCKQDDTTSNIGAIVLAKQELRPMKIVAPHGVRAGQEFTMQVVDERIGGDESSVSADLGLTKRELGLAQADVADGSSTVTTKDGIECVVTAKDKPYIYFDVRDSSMTDRDAVLEVKVRYFDEGTDTMRIQYNSSDAFAAPYGFDQATNPDHKGSAFLYRRNTRKWRTATFLLPDALLRGRMSKGADIRIEAFATPAYIASVTVTKKHVKHQPIANATITIGNDTKTTDSNGRLTYTFSPADPRGPYILNAYKDSREGYLPVGGLISVE